MCQVLGFWKNMPRCSWVYFLPSRTLVTGTRSYFYRHSNCRYQHRGLSNELPHELGEWPNYLHLPCRLPLWIWCHLPKGTTRYGVPPCGSVTASASVGAVGWLAWKLDSAPKLAKFAQSPCGRMNSEQSAFAVWLFPPAAVIFTRHPSLLVLIPVQVPPP